MFGEWLKSWRKVTLVKQAFTETTEMLKKTQVMYIAVSDQFLHGKEIPYDIYEMDKEINKRQMDIRKLILEHLSLDTRREIVAPLVLSAIVIYAERIGDYSKNVYELKDILKEMPPGDTYAEKLESISESIRDMFENAIVAFDQEDTGKAEMVMNLHRRVNTTVESMIREIAADSDACARESVTYVLFLRYLKRVSAHLSNIVSSVVNPYDRIGYFKEVEEASG